jgi:hypothetical protein
MRAIWVSAAAALFVLLAQAPASSMTATHHVYGHVIHGIVINHGHRIFGIIIVHHRPIGIPPVSKQ